MEAELRRRSWKPSTGSSPTPTRSCASCRTSRSRTAAAAGTLSPSQERRYKELQEELVKAVKSLSLNQNRIEALVEQLYDINKRLVQNEGRLLRLAESYGVAATSS
jgi:RNA polymerase primary sigma factor